MIGFLADGNAEIGMGHFMRCSCIADALMDNGSKVIFLPSHDSDVSFLLEHGYHYDQIENRDYIAEICRKIDIHGIVKLVIDSYRIQNCEICNLTKNCKTIYIDDLNMYDCEANVVVNFNIDADVKRYSEHRNDLRKIYTGSRYFPLRNEFIGKRKQEISPTISSVLITSGSTDPCCSIMEVLRAINPKDFPQIHFDILIGRFFSNEYKRILSNIVNWYENVEAVSWSNSISDVIINSDLLISSGSSTVFEALSLNIPCITFQFADNHLVECMQLQELGVAYWAGDYSVTSNISKVNNRIRMLFEKELKYEIRLEHSLIYSDIFDGEGTRRIVEAINDI